MVNWLASHRLSRLQPNAENAGETCSGRSQREARPALATTCFPSSRQTDPAKARSAPRVTALVRSFPEGLPPDQPARLTDLRADCAQLIVAFEAALCACAAGIQRNSLRCPSDSTTKRKEAEGETCWRRTHCVQCGDGRGGVAVVYRAVERSVVKTDVLRSLSSCQMSPNILASPRDRTQITLYRPPCTTPLTAIIL